MNTLLIRVRLVSAQGTLSTITGDALSAQLLFNFGTGGLSASSGGTQSAIQSIGTVYSQSATNPPLQSFPFYVVPYGTATVGIGAYVSLQLLIPVVTPGAAFELQLIEPEIVEGYVTTVERTFLSPTDVQLQAIQAYYETGNLYAPSTSAMWVPFKYKKNSIPTMVVTGGTASQTTVDGFLLTPSAAGSVSFSADASL